MWNQVREDYSSVIGFKIGNAVNMKLHVAVCDQSPCLPYKGLHHLGPYSALANPGSAQERELDVYPLLSELESDNTMQQTI